MMRGSAAIALALLLVTRAAAADQADCPPGSTEKHEDGFQWCEPSVCANDTQCSPGNVCVQMPLCMEVGNLTKPGATTDAGSRLIARQMCAEGTCPTKQTCSDLKRCLPRATAERMGKVSGASPSASATPSGEAAKKSSCGCDVVGAPVASDAAVLAAALGLIVLARRRRR